MTVICLNDGDMKFCSYSTPRISLCSISRTSKVKVILFVFKLKCVVICALCEVFFLFWKKKQKFSKYTCTKFAVCVFELISLF